MTWTGELLRIFTAETAGAAMVELDEAVLVAGHGIEGDRYATGRGLYSTRPHEDRQVTLIEEETLVALARDHDLILEPGETRRNLLTRDVPLNHLVGRHFRVGGAVLFGGRLNVPCRYLENLLGKPVFAPLANRSGLNCRIVTGGTIRPGDRIVPA
ncbi:MOSC domain-containing protein [Amycolatopsis thermoflava]|uniref:MOSC domain-containing protein n=1 Tax=Amycolatopsis thermoflava TaxID=84480 RepID=A0A3N2H439_9PSEU|nr:MOSC domain-containing protein [Amycolatopsis thermoflava]ROS43651.1 MOSC domain-containing protein [Amycolatopsis thermoflava]